MAYKKIKPVFEAKAQVVIRPEADGIFDRGGNVADFSRYHKTQVQLVTSTDVLSNTMAKHPELANWPMLRGDDPDAAIRDKLRVAIVLDTNLIEVALSSRSARRPSRSSIGWSRPTSWRPTPGPAASPESGSTGSSPSGEARGHHQGQAEAIAGEVERDQGVPPARRRQAPGGGLAGSSTASRTSSTRSSLSSSA